MFILHHRFRMSLVVVLGMTLASARPASASDAPPSFEEEWFVVSMQDPQTKKYAPCGHMHSVIKTVGQEVHSKTDMLIEIKRIGAAMKMHVEQSYRETVDGRPLELRQVMGMGAVPETLVGVVKGDKIVLTSEQLNMKKDSEHPFDPEIRFAWGQYLAQKKHGLKPGTTYTVKTFEPTLRKDGPIELSFTVHGRETIDVLGKSRELHRISNSLDLGVPGQAGVATVDSEIWVDSEFSPVVMTTQIGGLIKMRMFKTSREHALQRGAPPEMFLEMIVPTRRRVGKDAEQVKLRLRAKKGAKGGLPTLPDTAMQTFERLTKQEATLTIRRTDWARVRKVGQTDVDDPNVRKFLAASPVCNSEDRRIRRRAREAVEDAETPAKQADALRRFVTDFITEKGMDVGFATASEVIRNRAGDCSEHGVLLAAMARAAGLPARGVAGIVEVPPRMVPAGSEGGFGYHMWTQVYIGDQWVDLDAAFDQTECDPTHIAVSLLPLGDEGMIDAVAGLIPLLGQLEIEVLDVQE